MIDLTSTLDTPTGGHSGDEFKYSSMSVAVNQIILCFVISFASSLQERDKG